MSQTKTQLIDGIVVDAIGNVNIDSNTFYVDAANNRVGLGTSSPEQTLHVLGRSLFKPTSGSSVITLVNTSGGDGSIQVTGGATSMNYGFNTYSNSNVLYLQNDGKVGIGNTSPGYALDVASADTTAGNALRLRQNATAAAAGIQFTDAGVTTQHGAIVSDSSSNLKFATGNTVKMCLDSSGRLLVGTTSAFVEGFNNALTASQLSKGSGSSARCISDTRTVAAVNNSTVDVWVGRTAAGNPYNAAMAGHFYVTVGGANCFTGVYSIVTTSLGTSNATLAAVSTVTRSTSPVSSVQIAADGASGAIKLTITYINNAGVVNGLDSYVSFVGLAA